MAAAAAAAAATAAAMAAAAAAAAAAIATAVAVPDLPVKLSSVRGLRLVSLWCLRRDDVTPEQLVTLDKLGRQFSGWLLQSFG